MKVLLYLCGLLGIISSCDYNLVVEESSTINETIIVETPFDNYLSKQTAEDKEIQRLVLGNWSMTACTMDSEYDLDNDGISSTDYLLEKGILDCPSYKNTFEFKGENNYTRVYHYQCGTSDTSYTRNGYFLVLKENGHYYLYRFNAAKGLFKKKKIVLEEVNGVVHIIFDGTANLYAYNKGKKVWISLTDDYEKY